MAAAVPVTAPARPQRARPAPAPGKRPAPPPARRRPVARPGSANREARPRGAAFLDRLLRGRAWVWLIGTLLAGIVFLNVALLELNDGIARTTRAATVLGQENARLRLEAARLGSSERIQRAARAQGLMMPAPGEVRYLKPGPDDGRLAARRITEPDPVAPIADETAAAPVPPASIADETAAAPVPPAPIEDGRAATDEQVLP